MSINKTDYSPNIPKYETQHNPNVSGNNSVFTQAGYSTSETSDSNKPQNTLSDSVKSIDDAINKIKKFAVNLKDDECCKLLCCYKSYTPECMENDSKKLQDACNHVIETIKVLKNKKTDLTYENIKKWATNYNVALENGWESIEAFEADQAKNSDGLAARIKKFTNGVDITDPSVSKEEKLNAIKSYIENNFTGENLQKDFVKLLINSSSEERQLIIESLSSFNANDRVKFIEIFYQLATDEEIKAANEFLTAEKIDEISDAPDAKGNIMTPEQTGEIQRNKSKHSNKKQAEQDREYWNKDAKKTFREENKKRYEELKQKDPETLTDDERKFINQYERRRHKHRHVRANMGIGIAQNKVNTKDENQELLDEIISDAHEYPELYDEIIESIRGYIEGNPDGLDLQVLEDIIGMMNEATNGEYTYGPDNPDNPYVTGRGGGEAYPSGGQNSSGESSAISSDLYGGLGFEQHYSTRPQKTMSCEDLYPKEDESTHITLVKSESKTSLDNIIRFGGDNFFKDIKKHISETGIMGFVSEALNNKIAMDIPYIKQKVLQFYNTMDEKLRISTFNHIFNNKNATIIAKELNSGELEQVKAQNSYIKSQLELIKKEKEESV